MTTSEEAQEKAEYEQKKEDPQVQEIAKELVKEVNTVNTQAKAVKRAIFRKYAEKLEKFMPKNMICDFLSESLPNEDRNIRASLNEEYKDLRNVRTLEQQLRSPKLNRKLELEESTSQSRKRSAIADKKVLEQLEFNAQVETDGKVIKLKDQIEGLEEELAMVMDKHKKELEVLTAPQLIKIEDKFLNKIKQEEHRFLLVKDNFIWASWNHNPTPKEWKHATEEVGF